MIPLNIVEYYYPQFNDCLFTCPHARNSYEIENILLASHLYVTYGSLLLQTLPSSVMIYFNMEYKLIILNQSSNIINLCIFMTR